MDVLLMAKSPGKSPREMTQGDDDLVEQRPNRPPLRPANDPPPEDHPPPPADAAALG